MSNIIRFIGIDFGSNNSVVSYLDYETKGSELKPISNLQALDFSNGQGKTLIPSIVRKSHPDTGEEAYGCDVPDVHIEKYPDLIVKEFKMNLGTNSTKEERQEAVYLMYKFFKYIAKRYIQIEKSQNADIFERRFYISYPAKWEIEQKSLTFDAAYQALNEYGSIRSYDEPTAALHYCLNAENISNQLKDELKIKDKSQNILIIDMGAGTTDLVLYEYSAGHKATIIAKYPEPGANSITFGGREIDKIILDYLKKQYGDKIKDENDFFIQLECRKWKEQFSNMLNQNINETQDILPFRIRTKSAQEVFNKGKICWLLRTYLLAFPQLINGIIDAAKKNDNSFHSGEDIDFVILTGGHSQWFFVDDMLKGKWIECLPGDESTGSGINLRKIKNESWRLVKTPSPQSIVSYGLAMAGITIDLTHLSNSDIWLKIEIGESNPIQKHVLRKNVKLPFKAHLSQQIKTLIKSEMNYIPITLTPYIGNSGEEKLDIIQSNIYTSIGSDLYNWLFNVGKYRNENLYLDLSCNFDENMILSLDGTFKTKGFGGFEEHISFSSEEIARKIKETLNN